MLDPETNEILTTSLPNSVNRFFNLKEAFDENSIKFILEGGPTQTDVIMASATYIKGPNSGLPVPLNCTWYNIL